MTQDEFIALRNAEWDELDQLLRHVQDRGLRRLTAEQIARLGALYRALSGDIALAEGAHYGGDLVVYLERLAARAHATLYAAPPWRLRAVQQFLVAGFPRALRRNWAFFAVAGLLFGLPMVLGFVGALASPAFAERVMPPAALQQAAESYSEGFGAGRGSGEGAMMTGFYIYNNVGIAFRCFATGIFFGLGSVFFLIYNGLAIGTTLGYVVRLGFGQNIGSFIITHSPFELTAIVIAGAAGLQMGYALVRTRGETRLASLRREAPEIIQLVMGAAAMLLVAALIEGLWSGSSLPRGVKFAVGSVLIALVALYLARAGRAGEGAAAGERARPVVLDASGSGAR